MSTEPMDPQRLAALLDGRLQGAERDALLAQLAADEDLLGVQADAAAALREAGEPVPASLASSDADASLRLEPTALPRRARRFRLTAPGPLLAIAASILVLVAVPLVRRSSSDTLPDVARYAVLAGSGTNAPDPAWTVRRAADTPLTAGQRAARFGTLLFDVEHARRAGDAMGARTAMRDAAALLDDPAAPPGLGPIAARFRSLDAASAGDAELAAAGRAATEVLGEDDVLAGAWVQGARVAAARRDAGYFARDESAGMMRRLAERAPLRDAAERVQRLTSASDAVTWAEVTASLDELQRLLGG